MASYKYYQIDEANKKIYANILKLKEKEIKEIKKYETFGYEIVDKKELKIEVKTTQRLNDEYITDYLKDDKEALAKYKSLIKEKVKDDNGNIKLTSTGKEREKGFNAGRNWFSRTYPTDINVAIGAIAEENMTDKMEEAFKKYEKSAKTKKDASNPMNKDEYTRDYYWKKIFER